MNLKAKKIAKLKTKYDFEAPAFPASSKAGGNGKGDYPLALDLNAMLAPNPEDVYLVKVNGDSMIDEGIYEGDVLVVDKKEQAKNGSVVISSLNGELTVKTFRRINDVVYLASANKKFLPIEIKPFMEFQVQGVVKHVIHSV